MIQALSYVLVSTPSMAAWLQMAATLAGLEAEVLEPGQTARLRIDVKCQRFIVQACDGAPTLGMGYTVRGADDMQTLARRLADAGFACTPATADELALRGVQGMVHFRDPDGYRVEIAHGLRDGTTPFAPGRPIGGSHPGGRRRPRHGPHGPAGWQLRGHATPVPRGVGL